MGLISVTVGLPLLPVRGVLAVARTVAQQAEQERSSAGSLRRRLEALEQEHGDGADPLSARERDERMEQILGEVVSPAPVVPADAGGAQSPARPSPARRAGDA